MLCNVTKQWRKKLFKIFWSLISTNKNQKQKQLMKTTINKFLSFLWAVFCRSWRRWCWASMKTHHPGPATHAILGGHDVKGHSGITWTTVSSNAPHSQIDVTASPHSCKNDWNFPTPVRRRLSRTQQTGLGRPTPSGLALSMKRGVALIHLEVLSVPLINSQWIVQHECSVQVVHCAACVPQVQKSDETAISLRGQWWAQPLTDWIDDWDPSCCDRPERVAPCRRSSADWLSASFCN